MNRFILDLKNSGDFTAGSKARMDVETILKEQGFLPKYIYISKKDKNIAGTIVSLLSIRRQLIKIMRSLPNKSVLLVQYPWDFLSYGLSKIIHKEAKSKKITTIVLIHDLNSYRTGSKITKFYYNYIVREVSFLKQFDFVIVHNSVMKKILVTNGINPQKVVSIGIFDYLINKNIVLGQSQNTYKTVNIGGNLSPDKARYVYRLNELNITNYSYSLYGPYFKGVNHQSISYKGTFPADILPKYITNGFGLVWDGTELDSCNGNFGKYLKINDPHKVSMYIACGIPVIVWKKAAIAKFVLTNNLGIAIDSLKELDVFFAHLTFEDYQGYLNNVYKIRHKITNGFYLKKCINECIHLHEENIL